MDIHFELSYQPTVEPEDVLVQTNDEEWGQSGEEVDEIGSFMYLPASCELSISQVTNQISLRMVAMPFDI